MPETDGMVAAESDGEKANFGFTVRLDKNEAATGNLEFQYKAADIKLKSQSLASYTVSNNRALFQGKATINGEGLYTFRVEVTDEDLTGSDPDAFEIKIWAGADTELDPIHCLGNELAGGSIVIH